MPHTFTHLRHISSEGSQKSCGCFRPILVVKTAVKTAVDVVGLGIWDELLEAICLEIIAPQRTQNPPEIHREIHLGIHRMFYLEFTLDLTKIHTQFALQNLVVT